MWPSHLVHSLRVIKLDVQVLVHAFERPPNLYLVLELDCDFVLNERLEETKPYPLDQVVGLTADPPKKEHPSNY